MKPSIHLQLKQTGDENGGPPGRYRSARCGNPNLAFVEPAPLEHDNNKVQSFHHPYIYNYNLLGTNMVVPWVDVAPHAVDTST